MDADTRLGVQCGPLARVRHGVEDTAPLLAQMRPGLPLTPSRYRAIAVRETSICEFNWIRLHKDTFPNPQITLSYNNGVLSQLEEPRPHHRT